MQQETFGRQQRKSDSDLQSESSKERRNKDNHKQLRGESRGRGTESRHAPPPNSTGREKDTDVYIDESGSKIQKVLQRCSGCRECSLFQKTNSLQREDTQ